MKNLFIVVLILISSCTFPFKKENVITFNSSKAQRLIKFLDQLKGTPELDTTYEMEYFLKSRDIVFHYLDNKNSVGDNIYPTIIFSDSLKSYFTGIWLYILFRDKRFRYFDIHLGYFRDGRKEINMIIFDSIDSNKNNLFIKQLLKGDDKLIYFDKNVYYYESNCW